MLRVELLSHGCDAAAGDGLLAARAQGATALMVVHFTVGLAVMFEETAIHKWSEAFLWKTKVCVGKGGGGGNKVWMGNGKCIEQTPFSHLVDTF